MRVVLDTNVLLAALGTRGLCEALVAALLERHEVVLSAHILGEVRRHLAGKFRMPPRQVDAVVAFLRGSTIVVTPARVASEACPDRDDLPVLGTAVAARVDALVTGDRELLALVRFEGIAILSPRECYERLR